MPKPDWNTVMLVWEGLGKIVPKEMIWKIIKDLKTQDLGKLMKAVGKVLRIPGF